MIHVPAASVTTVRVNPVAVCVATTVTPGSTAALSSVTRPLSSAVACAHARELARRRTHAPMTTSRRMVRIVLILLWFPSGWRSGRSLRHQLGAILLGHLAEPHIRLAQKREAFDGDQISAV